MPGMPDMPGMMDRPLPLLAVSLLLGSLAGATVAYFPFLCLLFAIALSGLLLLGSRFMRLSLPLMCALFGLFLGGTTLAALAQSRAAAPVWAGLLGAGKVELVGEIEEPVRYGPGRALAVVSVKRLLTPVRTVPLAGRIRVTIRGVAPQLVVGDVIQFTTGLRPAAGLLNPSGFDYGAHLRRLGIQALGGLSVDGEAVALRILTRSGRPVMSSIDEGRARIRNAALQSLRPEAGGVYLALITGESGYLTQPVRDAFMASGTTHILSISGSHLGLIGVLVFWIVRRSTLSLPAGLVLRLSRRVTASRLAAAATLAPVTWYALLGGAEVATVRSLLMMYVFLGAVLLDRGHRVGSSLALAALLIVAWEPLAPLDISFQLSFLSVLIIVMLMPLDETAPQEVQPAPRGILPALRRHAKEVLLVSVAITVVTAPLVAMQFNQLPWIGAISNLVIVPFVGFLIVPLGLVVCLGPLFTGSDSLPGAPLIQALLDVLLGLVRAFAAIPGARLMVSAPPVWQILAFYIFVAAAYHWKRHWMGRLLAIVVLGLLALWAVSPRDLPQPGEVRITFLDVGQGDAALIETATGRVMLIDGGGASDWYDQGRAVVAPLLWDRGIRALDVVVATHPQQDHVGGLAAIARDFQIGEFWTNGVRRTVPFIQALEQRLAKRGVPVRAVSAADQARSFDPCRLEVLNPPHETLLAEESPGGKHLNNQSVVTRLSCGKTAVLFTGDIEYDAEAALLQSSDSPDALKATVLKVPHHGARGSVSEPFLRAVRPQAAVISVGRGNRYGHPAPAMLDTYRELQIPVLRTDRDGAVTLRMTPEGMEVYCEAARRLQRIDLARAGAFVQEMQNLHRILRSSETCPSLLGAAD